MAQLSAAAAQLLRRLDSLAPEFAPHFAEDFEAFAFDFEAGLLNFE